MTTKIIQHYRDDGFNRCLIPVNNPATFTNYYKKEQRKSI